jgi:hypothetical protein
MSQNCFSNIDHYREYRSLTDASRSDDKVFAHRRAVSPPRTLVLNRQRVSVIGPQRDVSPSGRITLVHSPYYSEMPSVRACSRGDPINAPSDVMKVAHMRVREEMDGFGPKSLGNMSPVFRSSLPTNRVPVKESRRRKSSKKNALLERSFSESELPSFGMASIRPSSRQSSTSTTDIWGNMLEEEVVEENPENLHRAIRTLSFNVKADTDLTGTTTAMHRPATTSQVEGRSLSQLSENDNVNDRFYPTLPTHVQNELTQIHQQNVGKKVTLEHPQHRYDRFYGHASPKPRNSNTYEETRSNGVELPQPTFSHKAEVPSAAQRTTYTNGRPVKNQLEGEFTLNRWLGTKERCEYSNEYRPVTSWA